MLPDIGLTGLAGSGKDTVGRLLVERHGYGRVGFADGVRDLLEALNPQVGTLPLSYFLGAMSWDEAKESEEIRRLLQALGHGARTVCGEDVWIRAAFKRANALYADGRPCVFTDVRYLNEAEAVEGLGVGVIVRVVRPGAGLSGENGSHVTETEQLDIAAHYTIDNSGSLDDLAEAVDILVNDLRKFNA